MSHVVHITPQQYIAVCVYQWDEVQSWLNERGIPELKYRYGYSQIPKGIEFGDKVVAAAFKLRWL